MPARVPTVSIYAGDTALWPVYVIKDTEDHVRDLVAEGWINWVARWRRTPEAAESLSLIVDTSRLTEGMLMIYATPETSRAMNGNGFWDIQAENGIQIKTWLRGSTKWIEDVTRA